MQVNHAKDSPIQDGKNKAWHTLAQCSSFVQAGVRLVSGRLLPDRRVPKLFSNAVPCWAACPWEPAEERWPEERRRPFTEEFVEAALLSPVGTTEEHWRNIRPRRPSGKNSDCSVQLQWTRILAWQWCSCDSAERMLDSWGLRIVALGLPSLLPLVHGRTI